MRVVKLDRRALVKAVILLMQAMFPTLLERISARLLLVLTLRNVYFILSRCSLADSYNTGYGDSLV